MKLGVVITVAAVILLSLAGCTSDVTPTTPTQPTTSSQPTSPPPFSLPDTSPFAGMYVVTGTVSGPAGEPIVNAAVEWTGVAEAWGDRGHGVLTDSVGDYRIEIYGVGGPGIPRGTIAMRATKAGYQEQARVVTLPDGVVVNFTLLQLR